MLYAIYSVHVYTVPTVYTVCTAYHILYKDPRKSYCFNLLLNLPLNVTENVCFKDYCQFGN